MKVSERGLKLIKHHEGVRKKPYRCAAALWTCGVGHVLYQDQARIPATKEGMELRKAYQLKPEDNRQWSDEEIDRVLAKDLAYFERGVQRLLPMLSTQGEMDGFCSASFNLGLGWLQRSPVRQAFNRGDKELAARLLLNYNRGGGVVLKGLVNRRNDEAKLILS